MGRDQRLFHERRFYIAAASKQSHLTFGDRQIIQKGIENGSSKKAMADLSGKDKSTIGKEIRLHRELTYKSRLPLECAAYAHCKFSRICRAITWIMFHSLVREEAVLPGPATYARSITSVGLTSTDTMQIMPILLTVIPSWNPGQELPLLRELGELIKPLLDKGQSLYTILEAHPEIGLSEKTIYTYIETGVFTEAGVPINCLDLKKQARRAPSK